MNAGDRIGQYTIKRQLKGAGKSMSAVAHDRDGCEMFVKWLPSPLYPMTRTEMPAAKREKRLTLATEFEASQIALMDRLSTTSDGGGNLVKPVHLFRHQGQFVKVTPYVTARSSALVSGLDPRLQRLFIRTFLLSLRELHAVGVVHGDLKPDNLLAARMPAGLVAKLIDFDEAYLSGEPPKPRRLGGDELYYSPELDAYKREQTSASSLTVASDMFSAALVIFRLVKGRMPMVEGDGDTCAERIRRGGKVCSLQLEDLPSSFGRALQACLDINRFTRPSTDELLACLDESSPHSTIHVGEAAEEDAGMPSPFTIAAPSIDDLGGDRSGSPSPLTTLDLTDSNVRIRMGRRTSSRT